MYHCKDGLFFERLPHGDVRIVKKDRKDVVVFETTVGRGVMASIMAACCDRGYTTESFYEAYEMLHAPADKMKDK